MSLFRFSLRLFQPQTPEQIRQIERSIRAEYTTDLPDRKILIHMAIRYVVEESGGWDWYWPLGQQPIQDSWWCPQQPDKLTEQSELVINVKESPLCFHDVGDDYVAKFICPQGNGLVLNR